MKVVSIANRKGGVGKTTTAINLATALSAVGKRVVVLDLDPQGNATTSLGVAKEKGKPSTYEVLIGICEAKKALMPTGLPNFDIMPSSPDLAAAEIELINLDKREFMLKKALAELNGLYDYVIIIPYLYLCARAYARMRD
jgi:chromosome partitioning protein